MKREIVISGVLGGVGGRGGWGRGGGGCEKQGEDVGDRNRTRSQWIHIAYRVHTDTERDTHTQT